MEEILIKGIDKKDSGLVIVKYNGNREATLNTKWQSQEVDYLEKDVGIGGRCKVEIVQKGQYVNITKIDMASAVKGNVTEVKEKATSFADDRSKSIIAQCLCKAVIGQYTGKNDLTIRIDDAVEMYKAALELL